jgi:hypothetical protein
MREEAEALAGARSYARCRTSASQGQATGSSASAGAPASLHALLSHLFASRFAHAFVYRLLRRRRPMTFAGSVDCSTALTCRRGCCRFCRRLRLAALCGLANCHWSLQLTIRRHPDGVCPVVDNVGSGNQR